MHWTAPIFLAYGDSSIWDIAIWLIVGVFGILSQLAANKKKKEQQSRRPPSPAASSSAARSDSEDSPTPAELAEIFKRLGADIPATPPPPPPMPRPAPPPAPQIARKSAQKITLKKPSPPVSSELAQRLARVRKEAEAAGRAAEAERIAINAIVHGVQSRAGETRALDTATRHTGAILPRLYAMSMRMPPLPAIPMPGLDRTHHVNKPLRTALHTRREVRDALIAQTFLQPAKGLAR